jgi:hypothetical protein
MQMLVLIVKGSELCVLLNDIFANIDFNKRNSKNTDNQPLRMINFTKNVFQLREQMLGLMLLKHC